MRLHEIVLRTQLIDRKVINAPVVDQSVIALGEIFHDEAIEFKIEEGELVEVLGRANGGKTTLLIHCAKQAIKKSIQPILLSSSQACTDQYYTEIAK